MESITLKASVREKTGRNNAASLRRQGLIPSVLYGGEENVHFQVSRKEFKDILYTDKFYLANIDIDGKETKAIVKDIQFHPLTDQVTHIDFQELVEGRAVKTEIPVKTTGFAKGVQSGGKLEMKLRKVKVKATPEQLVSELTIDVTDLELGRSIKVKEIDSVGLEILNPESNPVVSVVIPRALRSADSKTDKAEEGASPETGEENAEEAAE